MKKTIKVLIIIILFIVILFGIYRREYLVQAIPVYIQYLEQRYKWENSNTKTYAFYYYNGCNPNGYFFIKDNRIESILRLGAPYDIKRLLDKKVIKKYMNNNLYCGMSNENNPLIEKRFDEIKNIIWNKLFDDILLRKNNTRITYKIGYNNRYGYPTEVVVYLERDIKNNGKIDSFSNFFTFELIMLEKDAQYTKEVYIRLLKEFEKNYLKRKKEPVTGDIPILEQVGGDMILGAIFE